MHYNNEKEIVNNDNNNNNNNNTSNQEDYAANIGIKKAWSWHALAMRNESNARNKNCFRIK